MSAVCRNSAQTYKPHRGQKLTNTITEKIYYRSLKSENLENHWINYSDIILKWIYLP